MAEFFNFYPKDGGATVLEIPAGKVSARADEFGCVEVSDGLYVPCSKIEFVPDLGPSEAPADFAE